MIRPSLLLPLAALVASPVAAQDAWRDFVADLGTRTESSGCWAFVNAKGPWKSRQGSAGSQENPLLRLFVSRDFTMEIIPADAAQALWKSRGWKEGEDHWLLLSPQGEVVMEGTHPPSGEATLELLRGAGLVPRWERRAAFLQEHPEQGGAWLEALQEGLELAEVRINRLQTQGNILPASATPGFQGRPIVSFATTTDPTGADHAERVFRELADALEALLGLPDWQDPNLLLALSLQLPGWDTSPYPRLQSLLQRLYEGMLARMEAYPHENWRWMSLAQIGPMVGRDPLEAAARVSPPRGDPGPASGYLRRAIDGISSRRGWAAALAFLDGLPLPPPEPGPSADRWKSFRSRRADFHLQRFTVLVRLERMDDARGALEEARRWSGTQWDLVREGFSRGLAFQAPDLKAPLKALAPLTALKDPDPLPALPTPRLLLLGNPSWIGQWETLKTTEPLQAWGGSELRWERATPDLAHTLPPLKGGESFLGWALLLGNELVAQGTTCPSAQALADRVEAVSPSQLHRLNTSLQSNPGNLEVRRARAEMLLARKPRGSAEAQAAEDARLSRAPLSFPEGWKPTPDIWQWHAQKVLPELERELRSWPSRSEAWQAWIQWSEKHPAHPSILALIKGLALWGDHTPWRVMLPKEVHFIVAQELRRSGRFEEMRVWFQEAWNGVSSGPFYYSRGFSPDTRAGRIQEIDASIVSPLREALTALRRDRDLVALEAAFTALKNEDRRGRKRGAP